MGKRKIDGNKIYSLDYLMNKELNEDDLHNLFDKDSLLYSLVIGMFKYIGDSRSEEEIINMAKTNERWVYENFWTQEQKNEYTNKVAKVFENIYQYKNEKAVSSAQWFIFSYGLTVSNPKI